MSTVVKNCTIVLPNKLLKNSAVFIKGSKISSISKKQTPKKGSIVIDARGLFVSPGFIDTHIHGEPGEIFSNEARHGTTAFVIAQSCAPTGFIRKKIDRIRKFRKSGALGSNLLGLRLEGPYINKKMAGAQDKRFVAPPSTTSFAKIIKEGRGVLKMITLAP